MQAIVTQINSRFYHWKNFFITLLFIVGLNSCASIPEPDFFDYLSSFEQVQKMGELVLIDYAAAKKEKLALEQQQKGIPYLRHSSFQTNQLVLPEDSIDDVAIRFKAWEIVNNYNQALSSLIAGNPIKTEDKTKELLRTIVGVSGKAIVAAASNISPAFAALSGIATEIGKAYEQNKILAILVETSPIISSQLIDGMRKDAAMFYQVRYGLNNYQYQQINTKISRKISEFIKLSHTVNHETRNNIVLPILKNINDNLVTVAQSSTGTRFKEIKLTAQFGVSDSVQTITQLIRLKEQILELLEQAKQQEKSLDAYRQMLTVYLYMLNELDFQLKLMLQVAQEQQPVEILETNDFSKIVLRMRQAYLYYQNNKT